MSDFNGWAKAQMERDEELSALRARVAELERENANMRHQALRRMEEVNRLRRRAGSLCAVAEAAERALATLEWLTKGHDERRHAGDPRALKCRACEEKEHLAAILAAAKEAGAL